MTSDERFVLSIVYNNGDEDIICDVVEYGVISK